MLEKEIGFLESRIEKVPEGKLRITNCNGHSQYYVHKNPSEKEEYLSTSQMVLVKALAQKDYDERELESARKEKKLIDALKKFLIGKKRVYDMLSPKRRALVKPYDYPDEENAKYWLSIPYEKKAIQKGERVFPTDKGEYVRSKSEKIMADMLFHAGIPYKYERRIKFKDGSCYFPDFTILNKRTREVLILEHFGMMDDEDYRDSFFNKIHKYSENGYLIGVNLFVTFEGSGIGHDFDIDNLRRLIKECFV